MSVSLETGAQALRYLLPASAKFVRQPEPGIRARQGFPRRAPQHLEYIDEAAGLSFDRPCLIFGRINLEGEYRE